MTQPALQGFLVSLPTTVGAPIQGWPQHEPVGETAVWFHGYLANPARLRAELNLAPSASFGRIVEAGLRRWQANTAERIIGEYAVVIVNGPDAVLVGDRMGLRPLYYAVRPNATVVSTDLAALVRETGAWRELDEEYLADMFSTGMHLGPRTPYRGIRRLQVGQFATCHTGRPRLRGGWRPSTDPVHETFDGHQELLRDNVKRAVAGALSPDGTQAVELSGGLDTSTVLAAATGLAPVAALSFTHPGFPGSDESSWMRAALETSPAPWHPIDATEHGTFTAGPELGIFLPAPTRRIINWAPSAAEEAVARELGVSTLLTGEGGDAVFFAGLLPWYLADLLRNGQPVHLWREALRWSAESGLGRPATFWLRRAALEGRRRWRRGRTLTLQPSARITEAAPWLRREYVEGHGLQRRAEFTTPIRAQTVHGQAVVENVLRGLEFARSRHQFPSATFELRHPLLAPPLVDLALATPWNIAVDPRIDRAVQRYAFAGLVSEQVLRRRSKPIADEAMLHGFERHPQWREFLAERPQIVERGYADADAWTAALPAPGRVGAVTQFYTAIQIEVWLRHLHHVGAPALLTGAAP
ncbi:asparagine synthetase B family protein [Mycobacterium sp. UM_Kg27]|uniref:asparagine synthase-related protein n=1 Tax=Mycobacterium sp. UM_Kg27 TaxID=1545693 RepID=UPI00061AC67A|nr:asparagine synthetase B family protein [Mycobacterium sp. UM_Kg27]